MFSGATKAVRRFDLLLLEEGELYVGDFVATARWPPGLAGNWQRLPRLPGQLRLATKSLFFEPDDVRVPIIRLPFQHVEGLEGAGERRLAVCASRLVKMRANAADAPYVVERSAAGSGPLVWEFELSYATLEAVMPLAQQMMVASRLPAAEQDDFLQATMQQAAAGLRFDLGSLRSPDERIALELGCTLLHQGALVREPGRLLLTDRRLYFQPLHNISGDAAVSCHPLAAVAAAARRRSSLRDLALEVFFADPSAQHAQQEAQRQQEEVGGPFWGGASALFAFNSHDDREQAVATLTAQQALGRALPGGQDAAAACSAILEAHPSWLSRVTAAWQRGRMSNLHYLLFLNLASGRTLSDLSQYPVLPWVLSDYSSPQLDLEDPAAFRDLSRPVGALNPRRLDMLRERFTEMAGFSPEPPFLYGSHYSTPGFTMFWLVRAAPAHMLRLQAGRFDSPDRLFCSVREAWEGVTSANPADVKELTPEFFLRHDFLVNRRSLALGTRQDGRAVGDVELPPWAIGGAAHFQALLCAALEAPYVSANLHHWIDLIFGFKQKGEAAVEADNVFRHTCYEGAVDIDSVADRTERIALETQINEFGQCPRQLFKHTHPQRLVCPPAQIPPPPLQQQQPGQAASAGGDSASGALPLALVSTIIAAAAQGHGESPRLEVSPLLAKLDVVAARRRQGAEEAAATAAQAAAAEAEAAAAQAEEGGSSLEAGSPTKQVAAGSSGRLRSLGLWAAERKQAVGERLAGSVGAVRDAASAALAGPTGSAGSGTSIGGGGGGSSSRLQGLFSRKGSAASSAPDAAAGAGAGAGVSPASVSTADAIQTGSEAAAGEQSAARSSPQSPAGRMAAGLVGGIGGRLSSLTMHSQLPGSPLTAGAAHSAASSQSAHRLPAAAGAPEAATAPAAAAAAAGGGPTWKFSRRGSQPSAASTAAAGDSSDDEAAAAAAERQQEGHQGRGEHGMASDPAGGSPGQEQLERPSSAGLLQAQRLRMLRHSSGSGATHQQGGTAAAVGAGSGRSTGARGWYGPGLRDRLGPTRVLVAGSESVNGCALGLAGGRLHAYSASHSGCLRVHQLSTGEQVRASSISEQPLTSVALLPLSSASGGGGGQRHPLILCSSYDARVHAYSADCGRQLGSWQAAGDAVACLQVVGSGSSSSGGGGGGHRLITASWDGSIKVWELGEGRQPWDASFCQPLAILAAPSSVWALAASADGHLVLAGTEDGAVAAYDPRQAPSSGALWQQLLLDDNYVGGLALCPGGATAVAAAADGRLSLLDLRRGGAVAAAVAPSGTPLRCCATDGALALAGDEGGSLHMADVAQLLGEPVVRPGSWTPPQPDGLYAPLAAAPPSATNAVAVAPSGPAGVAVVTAHEGGLLRVYM